MGGDPVKLCAVGMVKDEEDVIGDVVRHLASEGVELIVLLDNGSTDRTRPAIELARRDLLEARARCEVLVVDDPEVGYYQSRKITGLLEKLGAAHELEWVIPFDADELWHADVPLVEFFAKAEAEWGCQMVEAQLLSHFASGKDEPAEPCIFRRFEWRDPDVAPLPKVAFRWEPGVVVGQGAHGVTLPSGGRSPVAVNGEGVPGALCGSELTVRHFPYRSASQFVRKARNGAAAYAATTLPDTTGKHWRDLGRLLEEKGELELARVYRDRYTFPDPVAAGQAHDAAPFCRWTSYH